MFLPHNTFLLADALKSLFIFRPLRAEETLPVRSHRLAPAAAGELEDMIISRKGKDSKGRKTAAGGAAATKKKKKRVGHRNTAPLVQDLLHNGENGSQEVILNFI